MRKFRQRPSDNRLIRIALSLSFSELESLVADFNCPMVYTKLNPITVEFLARILRTVKSAAEDAESENAHILAKETLEILEFPVAKYAVIQQDQIMIDAQGNPLTGDRDNGDCITRYTNGLLSDVTLEDGTILPAIEFTNASHIEHWKKGFLHCDCGPAVIDTIDGVEQYYLNGHVVTKKEVLHATE